MGNQMGRPPLGFKSHMFRLLPETVARIRGVIRLKKKEKNISEYVRTAIGKLLRKDEKDLGID
jgi:hypothetical protein